MIKKIATAMLAIAVSGFTVADDSLVSVESSYSVKDTADRFEQILNKKGITVFARINHSENAANVGLDLEPTEVIVFGNPKIGTPLMQCSKTVAIDLPQKVLFWQDAAGKTWLSYNNPQHLQQRHAIEGCERVFNKITGVLGKLSKAAASK